MSIKPIHLIILLLAVIFMAVVAAEPPFEQSTEATTNKHIQIEAPAVKEHKANESFNFYVHAHNSTDGTFLTNDDTSCIIHLYSPKRTHLVEATMDIDANGIDFEYIAGAGNFTEVGEYGVLFYCNVSAAVESRGGFFEHSFYVSPSGKSLSIPNSNIYIILLIFFATLIYILIRIMLGIPTINPTDNLEKETGINLIKWLRLPLGALVWGLMLGMLFMLSNIGLVYLPDTMLGLVLFSIWKVGMVITGIAFVVYPLHFIPKIIDDLKENKLWKQGFKGV